VSQKGRKCPLLFLPALPYSFLTPPKKLRLNIQHFAGQKEQQQQQQQQKHTKNKI